MIQVLNGPLAVLNGSGLARSFSLTLTEQTTLQATAMISGAHYTLDVVQDAEGNHVLAALGILNLSPVNTVPNGRTIFGFITLKNGATYVSRPSPYLP